MHTAIKICFGGVVCVLAGAAGELVDTARPVRVTAVHFAPRAAPATFSGSVQPRTSADLAFQAGGRVIRRPVNIGDHVTAGQMIAELDLSDLHYAREAAEAAMRAAEADAASARADLARYQRLGQTSAAYLPSEFDRRKAASQMADARLTQTAWQAAIARDQLRYGTLTADADGVITALPVQVGQVVSAGQTAATLAHSAETEVAIDVPENRLAAIRAATLVTISPWAAPSVTLHGRVREIGGQADAASRTFAVRVTVTDAPPGLLQPGMTAMVNVAATGDDLAVLPGSALCDQDGAPAVWVLDLAKGHAARRPVRVAGYRGDGAVLIQSGVAEGEQVVTAGTSEIGPDMTLTAWTGVTR
nr:efflux RND transporter periplasmic adaptor subunit [uncultured Rhodopila sp.]